MEKITTDILVIGGGINGTGIASDAAGRGLSVVLCEKGDLACATSSWSTKLIHGGLRYLENYEFKMVRESLLEREILLKKAPHLIHPLQFILPHASHLRPVWMIRMGLFLYDHLGKRVTLPSSKKINLKNSIYGEPLKDELTKGFSYYDCRTDDARLVALNAISAKNNGARILTHVRCEEAKRENNVWSIQLKDLKKDKLIEVNASAIVNATGAWVVDVLENNIGITSPINIDLVQGSHIIVSKLFQGDHAYILQNKDNRIVFAIPYQEKFTLIGTTDVKFEGDPSKPTISNEEINYLCSTINTYFKTNISKNDIVWTYSGVRALHDGDEKNPAKISRDYQLVIDDERGKMPILSVFGGKITTFRTLSEHAMEKLRPYFPNMGPAWTKEKPLPGGNLEGLSLEAFIEKLKNQFPWLSESIIKRYANNYGSLTYELLNDAKSIDELGKHFGHGLYEKEIEYLKRKEWARTSEDILWRRSKLGLFLNEKEQQSLKEYMNGL